MTSPINPSDAEAILTELASVFVQNAGQSATEAEVESPNVEARYRALVEQIPAVVFMAYLDKGIGEAYVSPQIEKTLGFSQSEWLEDPVRWYERIHPADKQRWSVEAAQMFLSGQPLRSAYRVIARDGHVVWFHCEAKMIRQKDGRPWFIHGVAFDITELKRTEAALQEERNVLSAILDTVGALVAVLDPQGRIVRFNRACEQTTGYLSAEVQGKRLWDLFTAPEERDRLRDNFAELTRGVAINDYESYWATRNGEQRLIGWSTTVLQGSDSSLRYVIATGIDITERKRLEGAILEISNREQRRIAQDLHDGLGQLLTGIAFMSKVLEQKLAEAAMAEAGDAAKIVNLVNEAVHKTRELARGLLPVLSEPEGLMSALEQWASEVEDLFHISCRFQCDDAVLVHDEDVANHLYRITQEAVHNAIKHGKATHVLIGLDTEDRRGVLTIKDNGSGVTEKDSQKMGMGLHIMRYRAGMIGGSFELVRNGGDGTLVTCVFPLEVC